MDWTGVHTDIFALKITFMLSIMVVWNKNTLQTPILTKLSWLMHYALASDGLASIQHWDCSS